MAFFSTLPQICTSVPSQILKKIFNLIIPSYVYIIDIRLCKVLCFWLLFFSKVVRENPLGGWLDSCPRLGKGLRTVLWQADANTPYELLSTKPTIAACSTTGIISQGVTATCIERSDSDYSSTAYPQTTVISHCTT